MLKEYRALTKQFEAPSALRQVAEAARQQSAMLKEYRALAKQFEAPSALRQVAEAARQQSAMLKEYRALAKQFEAPSALRQVAEAARQQSAMLKEYRALAKQFEAPSALRQVAEAARQQSAMLKEYRALAKQFEAPSALRQVAEAARQQSTVLEEYRALAKQFQVSPAMRQVAEAAKQLRQSSEVFGEAWDERLAEAVGRLERAEDIIQNAPEPEQAVGELVEDATTVQEAAPSGAQQSVNTLVRHVAMAFLIEVLAGPELEAAGEGVRELMFALIVALLITTVPSTALPDPPPAPGLSTSIEIESMTTAMTLPGEWAVEGLPAIVRASWSGGRRASDRVLHGPDS